ncbi:MAG: hypothetical protein JRN58_05210 [Nitrososphaerota archaeon]|nr:hypothetical protein [Nitrososphaerota archaeon]
MEQPEQPEQGSGNIVAPNEPRSSSEDSAPSTKKATLTIPPCERCGGERKTGEFYVKGKVALCRKCFLADAEEKEDVGEG